MTRFDEHDLRALSICAGVAMLLAAACAGVDGAVHLSAGTLIGYGVGKTAENVVKERKK